MGEEREPLVVHATELYHFQRVDTLASTLSRPLATSPVSTRPPLTPPSCGKIPATTAAADNTNAPNLAHKEIDCDKSSSITESGRLVFYPQTALIPYASRESKVKGSDDTPQPSGTSREGAGVEVHGDVFLIDENGQPYLTDEMVKQEISDTLEEAWRLPDKQRKMVLTCV